MVESIENEEKRRGLMSTRNEKGMRDSVQFYTYFEPFIDQSIIPPFPLQYSYLHPFMISSSRSPSSFFFLLTTISHRISKGGDKCRPSLPFCDLNHCIVQWRGERERRLTSSNHRECGGDISSGRRGGKGGGDDHDTDLVLKSTNLHGTHSLSNIPLSSLSLLRNGKYTDHLRLTGIVSDQLWSSIIWSFFSSRYFSILSYILSPFIH